MKKLIYLSLLFCATFLGCEKEAATETGQANLKIMVLKHGAFDFSEGLHLDDVDNPNWDLSDGSTYGAHSDDGTFLGMYFDAALTQGDLGKITITKDWFDNWSAPHEVNHTNAIEHLLKIDHVYTVNCSDGYAIFKVLEFIDIPASGWKNIKIEYDFYQP